MEYNKSNKKYFLFSTDISEDSEADAVIYPCERLKGISPASDTTCIMYFEPLKITDVATSDVVDKVTLTYTSGSFREVIKTNIIIKYNKYSCFYTWRKVKEI